MTDPSSRRAASPLSLNDVLLLSTQEVLVRNPNIGFPRWDNPEQSAQGLLAVCRALVGDLPDECVLAVWLDPHGQVCGVTCLGAGFQDYADVDTRRLIRAAAVVHAAHVMLVHNHPSGSDPKFSSPDRHLTLRVAAICALLDIPLRDHVLVAGDQVARYTDSSWANDLRVSLKLHTTDEAGSNVALFAYRPD